MNRANKTAIVVAVLLVIAALPFPTSSAQAQRPDSCLGGTRHLQPRPVAIWW